MTQLPMFTPPSEWTAPKVSDLPMWPERGRVCVDLETRDEQLATLGPGFRRGAYIIGVSIAIEDVGRWYIPLRHEGGDNIPNPEVFWRYMQDQAKTFRGTIVGANLGYDLDGLETLHGIRFRPEWYRDPQVAEPLLDELQFTYGLDAILARHGLPGKNEELLLDAADAHGIPRKQAKKRMWELPGRFVGPYAEWDADGPLKLLRRQEKLIDEQDLWQIYNLESRVIPICCNMRMRGVRIDFDKLAQVEQWAQKEGDRALKEVDRYTGIRLDLSEVNNKKALARPLEAIGVKLELDGNKQPKIDKFLLEGLEHEVGPLLRRAKQMNKLRTTFAASIRKHATNGRVHCTFNQLKHQKEDGDEQGAAYGRLSSSDPNLQQQPSRDNFANFWRSIYIADEGGEWACEDYSQQEPRWLVHFAEKCMPMAGRYRNVSLRKADQVAEKYRTDPTTDNHTMMAHLIYPEFRSYDKEKQKELRDRAKIIFLGVCYGMGGGKLCRSLGYPTKHIWSRRHGRMIEIAGAEGQAVLDLFDERLPFVKGLARMCETEAKRRGYIETVLGRRCRFPQRSDGRYDWTHKALNRLIQGSAADQTKAAMVAVEDAGHKLQLQVHDELDLTVESRAQAEEVATIMRECVLASVPFKVDVEIGPSWGELK